MSKQRKTQRTFIATAAATAIAASAIAPAVSASSSFTDVAPKYKEAVDFMVSKGAKGINATTFGTDKEINRADAAIILAKVLGLDTEKAPASGFTDVPKRAVTYVNAIKKAGITSGKTKTAFGSHDPITRGELAVWIQTAYSLKGQSSNKFTDVSAKYTEAVSALIAHKIANGLTISKFGTGQNVKRGDFALMLHKADATKKTPKHN